MGVTTNFNPLRFAIFNHKGGVGKTTLTVNIASAFANMGKRVLLVDSDPQCNLTSYLIEDSVVDNLLENSDKPNGETIWSALKPVVDSTGTYREVPVIEPIKDLYLLPGDVRLSEYESELVDYWGACIQRKPKGFVGTTALSQLTLKCAIKSKVEYILYDTGPNIGALNRAILLDCDYFIVPGACDLFSVRALKTLGHTLHRWIKDWETIKNFAPDGAKLLKGKPKFLGYIPQRFRVYRHMIAQTQASYLSRFERHIHSDLINLLKTIDKDLAGTTVSRAKLGDVKDFGTLVQVAQEEGVPLWQVSRGNARLKTEAEVVFIQIAKAIIDRMS